MTSCSASCGGGVVRQAREVLSESSRGYGWITTIGGGGMWRARLTRTVMGWIYVYIYLNIFKYHRLNICFLKIYTHLKKYTYYHLSGLSRFAAGYVILLPWYRSPI